MDWIISYNEPQVSPWAHLLSRPSVRLQHHQEAKERGRRSPNPNKKRNAALETVLKTYEPVVGVEVHAQLATNTKAYCSCSTSYGSEPNTNICPVCIGEPGALPVPNKLMVEIAAKTGMALGCSIAELTAWDRKNYFYPDTPKNYQITQHDMPIGLGGSLKLQSGKVVGITRIHMEEDSAKMMHQGSDRVAGSTHSLIDFNRAGIPLVEIVSEPDMRGGGEASEYGKEIQRLLRYLGASDGNMEEGSLRLDVNVSLRRRGDQGFGTKVELKNLNSFKAVQDAIDFEIVRQGGLYNEGGRILQETRLWDERKHKTTVMRVKEGLSDYRFFPEPDIPPLELSSGTLNSWRSELCELPAEKRSRYAEEFDLLPTDAAVIVDDHEVAKYFELVVAKGGDPREACKWIIGDIAGYCKNLKLNISDIGLTPGMLAEMLELISNRIITGKICKELLPDMLSGDWEGSVLSMVEKRGMRAIWDQGEIEAIVHRVMDENKKQVKQFKGGNTKLLGFFVGQGMKKCNGRADPEQLQKIVQDLLTRQ